MMGQYLLKKCVEDDEPSDIFIATHLIEEKQLFWTDCLFSTHFHFLTSNF